MAFAFVSYIVLIGLFYLPGYLLTGIGLYSLAGRRGIWSPWLAWVPGANLYLLGCLSDQYQAMVRGKNKNKRTVLLGLLLGELLLGLLMLILLGGARNDSTVLFALLFIPLWIAMAAMTVTAFLALYDIYVSCDPKNAVLFLVLSIIFSVTVPFFLFACRKKDLGFPL